MMNFGEVVSKLMREKNMSQSELARRSGVSRIVINYIVNGKTKDPTLSHAAKIAHALGMTIDEMIKAMSEDE